MFIIGGTYSDLLIDPQPIGIDEMILNYDMDASTFQPVYLDKTNTQNPTNLVYHSSFLINRDFIGVLWYDFLHPQPNSAEDQLSSPQRYMKMSQYQISQRRWRELSLHYPDTYFDFRFGHSLLPLYGTDGAVDEVLVFGGISFNDPINKTNNKLVVSKIDFKSAWDYQQETKHIQIKKKDEK